ncbi:deoxynucleoside kinase [Candidatus Wolfebacteria bacterium]|nr:deoxynucleoside kinase [Candidatus Wolfebacteria bacterium]
MKKGKLIVLDGGDGSGKATQTKLLVKNIKSKGLKVKTLDFPQYEKNFFGSLIGECLRGEHGSFTKTDPYIASVLYAADRFESKKKIEEWVKKGNIVVLDRYVSANQMHQGGKIKDPKELKKFLTWLDTMEFSIFKIPRPDIIIYLDVPVTKTKELLLGAAKKKTYLKGKKDQTENDTNYLENSRKGAFAIIKKENNWKKINCISRGEMKSREKIQEEIWSVVAETIKK